MKEVLQALMLSVREVSGTDGASPGTVSVEVDVASPWTGNDTRCSLRDLLMHGAGLGISGSITPGDATPAPRSLIATGPG
jgi:hypothetical protein